MSVFEDIKKGLLEAIDYESGKGPAKVTVLSMESVPQYMLTKESSNSVKHSRAAIFGEQVVVSDFVDTHSTLKKNIHIDESDAVFLGKR